MKIGIIGHGIIGSELSRRCLERNWETIIVKRSDDWLDKLQKTDVACLCISTLDEGEAAFQYLSELAKHGILVVTSEKGALGNYSPELEPFIAQGMIGYSATVGGGTRMIHWLKERLSPDAKEVHLIINGTLNYIFDGLSRGRTLDEVVEETKKLGYAEPGSQDAMTVLRTEAHKDIPMKVSIVLNLCGFGRIRAREIRPQMITEIDLKQLVREAAFRRYIISITKHKGEDDIIGGFNFKIGEWHVSAGFKHRNHNPLFLQLVPPGVNNAALIHGVDGTYILTGPGAGATPTVVGSIIRDIEDLKGTP